MLRKNFLRIISLILVLAAVIPSIVACKEPQEPSGPNAPSGPNNPTNPVDDFYIKAVATGKKTDVIADFSDSALTSLPQNAQYVDGTKSTISNGALVWDTSKATKLVIKLPASVFLGVCHYIEFTVTTFEETDTTVTLKLGLCKTPVTVDVNYKGSKTFKIRCEEFSVVDPYPEIAEIQLTAGSANPATMSISNIVATTTEYELSVPDGVELTDESLYSSLTQHYRELLVGSDEGYENSTYLANARSAENNARSTWNLFKSTYEDAPEKVFNIPIYNIPQAGYGTPYMNGGQIGTYYQTVRKMALGYGMKASGLYKNKELLDDILLALEYGYKYYYGERLANGGTTYGNWFQWDITIPMALTDILVIIENEISPELIKKFLSPFDTLVPHPMGAGANKMWMTQRVVLAGALERDAKRIAVAIDFMNEVFYNYDQLPEDLEAGDGGFYTDGSYVQHNTVAYTSGYGLSLIQNLTDTMYFMQGSRFAPNGEHVDNHYNWAFNNFRPVLYGDNFFASLSGREVNRKVTEFGDFQQLVISFIKMRAYAPADVQTQLDSLIKSLMLSTKNDSSIIPSVPYPLIEYASTIEQNPDVPTMAEYLTTDVFGAMARVAHHGPKYGVCISLSNTKIHKYEAINGENFAGWYHGDGMNYIYTDDYDYDYNFFWYANPYLMPGVTANTASRNYKAISSFPNSNDFAGGVEHGKYGLSGFILDYDENNTSGTFRNTDDARITAKKSYFMFDNEIICIGSDINDWSGYEVKTTVENRKWAAGDKLYVNGELVEPENEIKTTLAARTMYFTGMGGYVFLRQDATNPDADKDGNTVSFEKTYTNYPGVHADATAKRSFLEITLNHKLLSSKAGNNSTKDARYVYAYLPESTVEETEAYYADPDVALLRLSDSTHAVIETKLGIVACVFYENSADNVKVAKDSYGEITNVRSVDASTKCAVMISKNEDGKTVISVSDPTQNYSRIELKVTLDAASTIISQDEGVSATIGENGVIDIKVNVKNSLGCTFNLIVE